MMNVEDRLQIQDAIAMYSYTYDGRDAEAFAELFADDGIFEVMVPGTSQPVLVLSSRAAIREWAARRHAVTAGSQARHYQSGLRFDEVTAETARTRAMLLLVRQGATDTAPVVHLTGVYHDTWRRKGGRWQLARRTARVDRDPGF